MFLCIMLIIVIIDINPCNIHSIVQVDIRVKRTILYSMLRLWVWHQYCLYINEHLHMMLHYVYTLCFVKIPIFLYGMYLLLFHVATYFTSFLLLYLHIRLTFWL